MPGRESFHVGTNKYLKNANFSLCLGEDVYVAAFREKLIAGVTEADAEGDLRFSKKAIVIPSNVYYQFVDCVFKAQESFEQNSDKHWEALIYKHSKAHHIIGKYDYYNEDSDYGTRFSICIKWYFKNDRSFNRLVDEGHNLPIDTAKITGDNHYLRRGCYMDGNQVSILYEHLSTLMEFSYYETDSKKHVSELVDYATTNAKLRDFLKDKLSDYENMTYQTKVKILKHLLNEMFEDKKKDKDDEHYGLKIFLDSLANKTLLVFSLINYRLKLASCGRDE